MDPVYDLIVVGGGMVGSACARHASSREGVKVAIIGPGEPEDRADTEVALENIIIIAKLFQTPAPVPAVALAIPV
jgi:thioredoxin reductase